MTVSSGGFNDSGIAGVGFPDAVAGDQGTMLLTALKSLNFVSGVSGWQINRDGQAQFNEITLIVQSTNAAILIYANEAEFGTLIGSWAGMPGTDQYGNPYPGGISATQGTFTGMGMMNSSIVSSAIDQSLLTNAQIQAAAISGGTMVETVITFDTVGGALLGYATTNTVITHSSNGTYSDTIPANVYSIRAQAWAAGAGGDGGNSGTGGNGGGAAEYAEEPQYPVVPGQVIASIVGAGGAGAISGQGHGDDGGDTIIDVVNMGVYANGGGGAALAGTGSTNTIHHDGGAGGDSGVGDTGAAGGGGSAGSTGAGGNGVSATGSTGQNGGVAGTGGGAAGGKGGSSGANGNSGAAPGAAGGGAGAGSPTNTFNKTYTCTATHSYSGSDGTFPNTKLNDNGTSYQGGDVADTFNGKTKTWIVFNASQIQSDLTGVSLTNEKVTLNNNHSWYNSGMTVALGYDNRTSYPSTLGDPSGSNIDRIEYHVNEGATVTKDITNHGFGTAFQGGTANSLVLFKNSNSLSYYGYFAGESQSGPPKLQFIGTTGSGSNQAGNGQDGQVIITYVSTASLVLSVAPVAGTDQYGNPYPAGIMTAEPIQINDQAVASNVALASVLYSATGQEKYASSDSNVYNTGRQSLGVSGNPTINSTAFANIAGLVTNVGVLTYHVRGAIYYTPNQAAGTAKLQFASTATMSGDRIVMIEFAGIPAIGSSAGWVTGNIAQTNIAAGNFFQSAGFGTTDRFVIIDGWITVSAAGTWSLQAACTNAADTWLIHSTSYIELLPVT
jgi:hypothetical protein